SAVTSFTPQQANSSTPLSITHRHSSASILQRSGSQPATRYRESLGGLCGSIRMADQLILTIQASGPGGPTHSLIPCGYRFPMASVEPRSFWLWPDAVILCWGALRSIGILLRPLHAAVFVLYGFVADARQRQDGRPPAALCCQSATR